MVFFILFFLTCICCHFSRSYRILSPHVMETLPLVFIKIYGRLFCKRGHSSFFFWVKDKCLDSQTLSSLRTNGISTFIFLFQTRIKQTMDERRLSPEINFLAFVSTKKKRNEPQPSKVDSSLKDAAERFKFSFRLKYLH